MWSLVLLCAVLSTAFGAQWVSTNFGDEKYACVGGDVTFPWKYSLSGTESLTQVQWFYEGSSSELISFYSHNVFLPLPAFSHRVAFVDNGGLTLQNVVFGDTGNYTVEVTGHDGAGVYFTLRKTVYLYVADGLMTTDGRLHAEMMPRAEFNPARHQYEIALRCGNFTFGGTPPYPVEWVSPSGRVMPSTGFRDNYYYLLLPNPLSDAGQYTCRIPQSQQNIACVHDAAHGQATVGVDKTDARLILLETQQSILAEQNDVLIHENKLLSQQLQALQNTHPVYFMTRGILDADYTASQTIVLGHVVGQEGGGFNPQTGKFTAPKDGTYLFQVNLIAVANNGDVRNQQALLMVDNQFVAHVWSGLDDHYVTGVGTAVVALRQGQTVYLQNQYPTRIYWESVFSGVLIG